MQRSVAYCWISSLCSVSLLIVVSGWYSYAQVEIRDTIRIEPMSGIDDVTTSLRKAFGDSTFIPSLKSMGGSTLLAIPKTGKALEMELTWGPIGFVEYYVKEPDNSYAAVFLPPTPSGGTIEYFNDSRNVEGNGLARYTNPNALQGTSTILLWYLGSLVNRRSPPIDYQVEIRLGGELVETLSGTIAKGNNPKVVGTFTTPSPVVIAIILEPPEVAPAGTGGNNESTVTVQATRSGQAVENLAIELESEPVEGSGGHSHDGNRPKGVLSVSEGLTGGDGKFQATYTSSKFGGEEKIIAKVKDTDNFQESVLSVQVAGLVEVPSSDNHLLKGESNEHPENHYIVNEVALDSLKNAAKFFRTQAWNTTGKMLLNDLSLKQGGGFDIKGNWESDIAKGGKGHISHRAGRDVDIENIILKDTVVAVIDEKTGEEKELSAVVASKDWIDRFAEFMLRRKWEFFDEGQTAPETAQRSIKFPHFDWKGN